MERFASGVDEDARDREAQKIIETEMNISEFQVEPEMEKVQTDFYILPHSEPYEIKEPYGPLLPLNYYDNDDGFWDEYI